MTKQRPDPDKMANELAGASAFFRSAGPATPERDRADEPSISPGQHVDSRADNRSVPQPTETRSSLPQQESEPVRPVRPVRRIMIRHPFELYADQLERLRERADLQKRQGEAGSMSKMVRDAIDRLLDDQLS